MKGIVSGYRGLGLMGVSVLSDFICTIIK